MEIAKYPDPILTTEADEVQDSEFGRESFQKFIDEMISTMEELNALGLAGPQVFLDKKVFVYRKPDSEVVVAINPTIISKQGKVHNVEYCLSCKDGYRVKRFKRVTVAAQDRYGTPITINSKTKREAFCIQHEIDHLNGIVIINKGKAA